MSQAYCRNLSNQVENCGICRKERETGISVDHNLLLSKEMQPLGDFIEAQADHAELRSVLALAKAARVSRDTIYVFLRAKTEADLPEEQQFGTRQGLARALKYPSWHALLEDWRSGRDSSAILSRADALLRHVRAATMPDQQAKNAELLRDLIREFQLQVGMSGSEQQNWKAVADYLKRSPMVSVVNIFGLIDDKKKLEEIARALQAEINARQDGQESGGDILPPVRKAIL